jgi:hypothetical protein
VNTVSGRSVVMRSTFCQLLVICLVLPGAWLPPEASAPAPSQFVPTASEVPAPLELQDSPGGLDLSPSADGAFSESLPVRVPTFHGIEPHISLDYDSAAGNGEMGVGWRLAGGSRIVRIGSGGALARYDGSDGYAVDGEELVPCTAPCLTGGTHETRRQSFERFVFDQQSWTRWRTDGVKFVYYTGNFGHAGYEWLLHSVTDTHGNEVRYTYDCLNACLLTLITCSCATGCGQSR